MSACLIVHRKFSPGVQKSLNLLPRHFEQEEEEEVASLRWRRASQHCACLPGVVWSTLAADGRGRCRLWLKIVCQTIVAKFSLGG